MLIQQKTPINLLIMFIFLFGLITIEVKATSFNNVSNEQEKIESSEVVISSDNITIKRIITFKGYNTYQVDLEIKKSEALNRFGKIEEFLPEGFTANEINSEKGLFSFENNMVKILWMTMPEQAEYMVSYEIITHNDNNKRYSIHGMVSYLNKDQSIQENMKENSFKNYFTPMLADVDKEEIVDSLSIVKKEEPTHEKAIKNDNELTYRIQIAAVYKDKLDINWFVKKHNITEEVSEFKYQNWTVYTIHTYNSYDEAKEKRDALWNEKVKDAFVVAIKDGKRISIQEALSISNEK